MDVAIELQFLRYFYSEAGQAFGPADDEIYRSIARNFEEDFELKLPPKYSRLDIEEDEDGR